MKTRQIFFLITGTAFLLLSAGGIFKSFAYKYLPLIAYVRLDGEFVIFSLFCFITVAAISLNDHIQANREFTGKLKLLYYLLEILLAISIVFGLYKIVSTHESFVYQFKNITAQNGLSLKLKTFIDSISFYDTLWLQGSIQMLLLWGIKYCLRERLFKILVKVCIIDMVLATLLNVPFTGVGKASVAQVQSVLNKSPKKIPIPPLTPILNNDTISTGETGLVGNWSFYNKQPGVIAYAPYPIELNNSKFIFSKENNSISKPYLFTTSSLTPGSLKVTGYSGNSIDVSVDGSVKDSLVFQQSFYRHWYYITENKKYPALVYKDIFLAAPLSAGKQDVRFVFDPSFIRKMMFISAFVFILFFSIYIFLTLTQAHLRSRK